MSISFDSEEPVKVNFVIYKECEDDSSHDMKIAYQMCEDQSLDPTWITKEECLKCNPTKTDVFVCEEFEGEAFSYLKTFSPKCIVIGPRCIIHCMTNGSLVPRGILPIFTIAMRDLVVTTTGFTGTAEDTKASIIQKIQYMGGTYSAEYRQSITHVVANKLLSVKQEVAVENKIPVMTAEWVFALWEASQKNNVHATDKEFLKYKCPIFYKMVVTCSQLSRRLKEDIKLKIDSNGGEFSGQLQCNKTSLLLITKTDGDKYTYAHLWKIPCVKPAWVMDSVDAGYALPLEKYLLGGDFPKVSTPEATVVSLPDISVSCIQGLTSAIGDTMLDSSTRSSKASVSPVGKYVNLIDELNMTRVKRAGTFLDGCTVYLSGFNAEYTEKLRKVLNSGGAVRFNEISDAVTHVIVGDFVPEDIKIIKSCGTRLHVVTVEWLLESVKLRSAAPADRFSCSDALPSPIEQQSPLSKKGLLVLHNTQNKSKRVLDMGSPVRRKENLEPKSLVQQYLQAPATVIEENTKAGREEEAENHNDSRTVLENANSSTTTQDEQSSQETSSTPAITQNDILKGLKFSIAGYKPEETHGLENMIRSCGGQVVRQNFSGIPDYGIVPIHGASLKHTTTEVVTFLWLDDCLEEKQTVPIKYYHQPITFNTDLKPLADCVMSITSYTGNERRFISLLIEGLGALSQAMFARVDHPDQNGRASTHLICPNNEETRTSRKYKAAVKWDIPAVTHLWLLECAKEGKKVNERNFNVVSDSIADNATIINTSTASSANTPARYLKRKMEASAPPDMNSPASNFGTPKLDDNDSLNHSRSLQTPKFTTPKAPGYMSTPETPYGQVFKENPSPSTRKKWKKFINQLPEIPQFQPTPPKQRRLSTPMSEIKRRCWEKFGAGYVNCEENTEENTENSVENADSDIEEVDILPKAAENSQVEGHTKSLNSTKDRSTEGTPQRTGAGPSSQASVTPVKGAGINTQLQELDKIFSSSSKRNRKRDSPEEPKEKVVTKTGRPAPESLDVCGDFVEWVDPAASSKKPTNEVKKTPFFMLTSLEKREYYEVIIRSLGGIVSTKQQYEKDATHLVCQKPSRSEKLLSCIAAGKWVLDISYLEDSKKAGRFLEEELYEWGNPKSLSLLSHLETGSLNYQLALAVHRWRCKIEESGFGAFHGLRAIVCTAGEKGTLYSRLIEAGGGTVLDRSPPFSDPGDATICIIELAKVTCRVDLESLARHKVPCVPPIYLNNYLIQDPIRDPTSCLLPEYEAVLMKLQQE